MTLLLTFFIAVLVFALGFSIARNWPFEAKLDNAKTFSLKALLVVVTTICVVLGAFRAVPYTLGLVEREPLGGIFFVTALAFVVTVVVVGAWRLAGKA